MKSSYDRYIGPRNLAIVIVGRVAPVAAFALVKKYFADWTKDLPPPQPAVPLTHRPRQEILVVPRPKVPAVVISLGQLVTGPVNESQLRLAASLFSFRATQIYAVIAESELAVPFIDEVTTSKHGSLVKVVGLVPSHTLGMAMSALKLAATLGDRSAVISLSKNYGRVWISTVADVPWIRLEHAWNLMDAFSAPQKTSAQAARLFLHELPNNYYETQLDALQASSQKDLIKLIQSLLTPEKAHIVLEGDPQIIPAQLANSALGPLRILDP